MRPSMLVFAALAVALPAAAQQAPRTTAPDVGFFPPLPNGDVSLTHTLPAEAYQPIPRPSAPAAPQAPAPAPAPASVVPATSGAPIVVVVPEPARRTEDQMDRSREEAAIANAAAAREPHINGAFTGLTDERDR